MTLDKAIFPTNAKIKTHVFDAVALFESQQFGSIRLQEFDGIDACWGKSSDASLTTTVTPDESHKRDSDLRSPFRKTLHGTRVLSLRNVSGWNCSPEALNTQPGITESWIKKMLVSQT